MVTDAPLLTDLIPKIKEIFENKIRERAGITLPASGLRLIKVFY